jgi:hypothetical protein
MTREAACSLSNYRHIDLQIAYQNVRNEQKHLNQVRASNFHIGCRQAVAAGLFAIVGGRTISWPTHHYVEKEQWAEEFTRHIDMSTAITHTECTQSRPVDPIVSNGDAQRGSLWWHCENGMCVWHAMRFPTPSMFQVNWKAKGLLTIQMDPSIKRKCFPEGRAITCKRYWWLPHNELYQWLLIENRLEFSLSLHVPTCLMFAF